MTPAKRLMQRPPGISTAMGMKTGLRRIREGRRKAMALQRRVWLAELALWPTAILTVVSLSAGAWLLWRRASRERNSGTFPAAPPPVDAAQPAPEPGR